MKALFRLLVAGSSLNHKKRKFSRNLVFTRCHSLSLVVAHCHSLSLILAPVVTYLATRSHSLSLVFSLSHTVFQSFSVDVSLVYLFVNNHQFS